MMRTNDALKTLLPRLSIRFGFVLALCLIASTATGSAAAQNNPLSERVADILKKIPEKTNSPSFSSMPEGSLDPELLREHNAWKHAFERRIYEWQFVTTKIIFWMVLAMVAAGMYFSWMHFKVGLRPPPQQRAQPVVDSAPASPKETAAKTEERTELTGPGGFKLSTPILGVVILGFSFIFFYLYLEFVYPIT